ncbi:hypothetical protein Tco_0247652 [Tanacetum coccineum]
MQTMMLKMFEIHRQKQAEQREEEKRSAEEQATQDEHLDTIPEMESDEVIKSSVENLVQTPSESKDLSDNKKELNSEISDAIIESFSSSPIPVKDRDVLFLEELLNNDSISLPGYESFHVDFYNVSSSPRSPEKPPDDDVYFDIEPDTGVLTTKVVDDISNTSTRELYGHVPNVLTTLPTLYLVFDTLLPFSSKNEDKVFNHGILIPKKEKSPPLLSHRGFEDYPDYEDSRARGFVQRSLDLHPFAWPPILEVPISLS